MTTPRDEATALLAEALHPSGWIVITDTDTGEEVVRFSTKEAADAALRGSPTLAADLEFAAAWRRVERALPEGTLFSIGTGEAETWSALAWKAEPYLNVPVAGAPTPTAALTRLAETLEAMR